MLAELTPAVLALLVASAALFAAGRALSRRLPRARGAAVAVVLSALVLCATVGQDRLFWARVIPWPDGAVVAGGSTLPAAALLAGCVAPLLPVGPRGVLLLGAALCLSLVQTLRPLSGAAPATGPERVSGGVLLQTSDATCSAASAATLLRLYGIPATEAEMARLCLTRPEGTPMLGVYRGLRFKTTGTGVRVSVLSGANLADLRRAAADSPVLISVGLDRWQRGVDPRYEREWGWTPGRRHAVLVLGFLPGGKVAMGDPSVGREEWHTEALSVLWHGEGIRLARDGHEKRANL